MIRSETDWLSLFVKNGALWFHDGDPERPHPILTSEHKHSKGYFISEIITDDQILLQDIASDLVELFIGAGGVLSGVYGVVGPQKGATKIVEATANEMSRYGVDTCLALSPYKVDRFGERSMDFTPNQRLLIPRKWFLVCDDAISTGGSVNLTATAIRNRGGCVLPFVLTLFNRSGESELSGKKILALSSQVIQTWEPDDCELCKSGSKAVRPEEGDNWARMNATY